MTYFFGTQNNALLRAQVSRERMPRLGSGLPSTEDHRPSTRVGPFTFGAKFDQLERIALGDSALNCYQEKLDLLAAHGLSNEACAANLTETYLDGKSDKQGKCNIGQRERHRDR
jgi:hypothetical protein